MSGATNADIWDAIFGSGCFVYSWWVSSESLKSGTRWEEEVSVENPYDDTPPVLRVLVNPAKIRKACTEMAADETLRTSLRKECRNLLYNNNDLDMDAVDADCVLQYVMFDGEIVYG